ncbi:hypothetical protein Q3G72_017378 [Acer saccharum]|nr:hypothetical protein Q3G72_017378 [Acer saccharum]
MLKKQLLVISWCILSELISLDRIWMETRICSVELQEYDLLLFYLFSRFELNIDQCVITLRRSRKGFFS